MNIILAIAIGLLFAAAALVLVRVHLGPTNLDRALSLDVLIVIVTGIVGALLAETVCKLFHITDPIAKGVGIGTAAHAVGTSKALQMGEVEGAMSGLSIAVAGVLTAVLCPVFVNLIN